jgi:hypothetical protein
MTSMPTPLPDFLQSKSNDNQNARVYLSKYVHIDPSFVAVALVALLGLALSLILLKVDPDAFVALGAYY